MNFINDIYLLMINLSVFLATACGVHYFLKLPKNITVLFLAAPLVGTSAPIMVSIGSIVSLELSPNSTLATLPLGLMVAGTALSTIPAALLAGRIGRGKATITGFLSVFTGSLLAAFSIVKESFLLFCVSAFLIGVSLAFAQQLRFAAIESVDEKDINKALSVLMFGGIFSAFLGPEVAVVGQKAFANSIGFAGSYLFLAMMVCLSIIVLLNFRDTQVNKPKEIQISRPLLQIIRQPIFLIAMLAAALSYGLMSFIMTSTPLSMNKLYGYDLTDTKLVIQSHIAAMYLPSLVTSWLSRKIGIRYILLIGSIMFAAVVLIATQGHSFLHYWWALVILGIAWNFLFFSGTSLLHFSYYPHEKHKVQAINDFSVFTFQGFSSLMAGWVLFRYGWSGVIYASIPFVIIMFALSFYYLDHFSKLKNSNNHN